MVKNQPSCGPHAGTRALSRCDDDIRLLQLEVAELQRKLFATQKTAPDVTTYDRNIAQLKADVFKARREAEQMSVTLEDPKLAPDRQVGGGVSTCERGGWQAKAHCQCQAVQSLETRLC